MAEKSFIDRFINYYTKKTGTTRKSQTEKIRKVASGQTKKPKNKDLTRYGKGLFNKAVAQKKAQIAAKEGEKVAQEIAQNIERENKANQPEPERLLSSDERKLISKMNAGEKAVVEVRAAFDFTDSDSDSDKGRKDKVRSVRLNVLPKEIGGLLDAWATDDLQEIADYLAENTKAGVFMGRGKVKNIQSIKVL